MVCSVCRATAVDYAAEPELFEWDIPEHYNIPAAIEPHADAFGDRIALRFHGTDSGREERTYGDLRDDMNRFANAFESMDVGKGDQLIHLLPHDPDVFAVQLAALKRGALLVPNSLMLRSEDIAFRANDYKVTTTVVHESLVGMVGEVRDETPFSDFVIPGGDAGDWAPFSDLVADASTEYDDPALRAEDPMSINYTPGTIGQPKPVRHHRRRMRCFELVNASYWWGVMIDDDLSDELPWATTGTGWAKWFWSPVGVGLTTGAIQFVYHSDLEPDAFLGIVEEKDVTRLCAVPTQYRMFAQRDPGSYDLRLREALSAGEPLNREPIEAFRKTFGVTPRDGYGQTETVALLTNYPDIDMKLDSMGKPAPGLGATIINENEEEVGVDETGEIAVPVGRSGIFNGYYEKPNLDEKMFSDDHYRTGDLASRDEDGYFFSKGRADDTIVSAGYRIGPFEVEDALVSHEAVAEAAAIASSHEERGSIVKAFVVLTDGYEGFDDLVDELQPFMKAQTTPYKYPREIEFVVELPKTSSGKIRRIELRSREQD